MSSLINYPRLLLQSSTRLRLSSGFISTGRSVVSASSSNDNGPKVTLTDDGSTIVCWHPKQTFPYEHSLPYADAVDEPSIEMSAFKPDVTIQGLNRYDEKGPSLEELQTFTYTPKLAWKRTRYHGIQRRPRHPRDGV